MCFLTGSLVNIQNCVNCIVNSTKCFTVHNNYFSPWQHEHLTQSLPNSHCVRLQRCHRHSNNSVTVLALERSIFISGGIDFFLIKTLNCNKFKEKQSWVHKSLRVETWAHTNTDLSPAQYRHWWYILWCGWHFSERCMIDFSITTGND